LLIFHEGIHFPSQNFFLKKDLGEPTQFKIRLQFGRARQPVRINPSLSFKHNELGVMGKLARIATGVFEARHSHVWERWCYGSKINKDKLIKLTVGLAEPMREGDMTRAF
jgi:hypothetical protein